jgi:uncharacterized protein YceK
MKGAVFSGCAEICARQKTSNSRKFGVYAETRLSSALNNKKGE